MKSSEIADESSLMARRWPLMNASEYSPRKVRLDGSLRRAHNSLRSLPHFELGRGGLRLACCAACNVCHSVRGRSGSDSREVRFAIFRSLLEQPLSVALLFSSERIA